MTQLSIESLDAPINVGPLRELAEKERAEGDRKLIKLGLAVLVLDDRNRMLTLKHEARDREFKQKSLGPSMETFRFVSSYGPNHSESPLDTWVRSLDEELPNDNYRTVQDRISAAGLIITPDFSISMGEWSLGRDSEGFDCYASAISVLIRVEEPQVLLATKRSEEIIGASFLPIDFVLEQDNLRPGFGEWLQGMTPRILSTVGAPIMRVEYNKPQPETGIDVRFDGADIE